MSTPTPDMPPQSTDAKILRIGLLIGGSLLEERLLRKPHRVTFGTSERDTFIIPLSTVADGFPLLEIRGGRYELRFTSAMTGKVGVGREVVTLEQTRERGMARADGDVWVLPLAEIGRGMIKFDGVTVILQFVTPPPPQPKPQLPPSVKGGLWARLDRMLAACFIFVGLAHLGFLGYLRRYDVPKRFEADYIPDNFAEYVPAVQKPAMDMRELARQQGEKAKEKAKKVEPKAGAARGHKEAVRPCDEACQRARAEARRARLAEQVSKMGLLKLLGTKGAGTGVAQNLLRSGDPGTDAQQAFQGVSGISTGARRSGGVALIGSGSGKGVDIESLGGRVGGPDEVNTGQRVSEKVPKMTITHAPPQIDGRINSDAVGRTIRLGMPSIHSCYQRGLRRDPKLNGKITIRLTINALGAVTEVAIDSDTIGDAQVASCIQSYAARWRFQPPEGGNAEITVPLVFTASSH